MKNQVIYRLAVASVVPFMLAVVAPLSFYFGNINEINFQLYEVVWPTLMKNDALPKWNYEIRPN